MNYELLAEKTRYLKENPEGVSEMCKVMEELRNESYKEYAVRNSNINFDDDKPIYVFYSEWNCEDSADHTGRV